MSLKSVSKDIHTVRYGSAIQVKQLSTKNLAGFLPDIRSVLYLNEPNCFRRHFDTSTSQAYTQYVYFRVLSHLGMWLPCNKTELLIVPLDKIPSTGHGIRCSPMSLAPQVHNTHAYNYSSSGRPITTTFCFSCVFTRKIHKH
jgi:hypothetical protein